MGNLTLLIKPASSLCNMRCRYCFYEDEAENRAQKSMGIMAQPVMEALLQRAMDYIGEGGFLTVVFQGGEPTLAGADYFEAFTARARELLPPGARVHYSVQTNGYALSQELLAVFRRNRFLVGLSIDGYRALHDGNRPDAAGAGTWRRTLETLGRLQAAGLETNALCVITAQAAENGQKIYRTLKQLGLRYQQYIPCLDPLEAPRGSMPFSLTPEAYGRFLRQVFDLWYADWKRGDYVSVRTFEDWVFNAMGLPCGNCAASGACGAYLVIEADGSAYPCDFFALDRWKLGNICQTAVADLLTGPRARQFVEQRKAPPADCEGCPHRALCRTGCFRDWEATEAGYRNHYCPSFQAFFAYAGDRLRQVAAAEQASRRGSRKTH